MSKKSDDSIERIFRQALTQYDTTFQKNDWLKMEKMLDEEAVRTGLIRSKRIKGIGFALTGLTVLFIAVYFLAFNPSDSASRLNRPATEMQAGDDLHEKGNVTHEKPSDGLLSSADSTVKKQDVLTERNSDENATETKNTNPSVAEPSRNDGTIVNGTLKDQQKLEQKDFGNIASSKIRNRDAERVTPDSQNKAVPSSAAKTSLGAAVEMSAPSDAALAKGKSVQPSEGTQVRPPVLDSSAARNPSQSSAGSGEAIQGPADSNIQKVMAEEKKDSYSGVARRTAKIDAGDSLFQRSSQEQRPAPISSEEANGNSPSSSISEKKDSVSLVSVDSLADRANAVDSVKEESKVDDPEKEKSTPASRFSIGVLFAPEFSTPRLSHYSAPGESIGLRIGYQLSNRLLINTGIIRSTKKYKDSAGEYSPNPNYWNNRTNGVIPDEIDSKCLVYEIPLAVQFNLLESAKSRAFVSAGLVSYVMVSQAYYYNFEQPNPGADNHWETSRTEKYWFGVGMLSAGYERYLSRSLALGFEPYLKTSLTEIGWPNVKLFSAGAYVTLRYRFLNKTL